MVAFLVGTGFASFKVIAVGIVPSTAVALAWGIVFSLLLFVVLAEMVDRLKSKLLFLKYLSWWRKKTLEEAEAEESDRHSIMSAAVSVRSRRTRINLDFFKRRKKDSRRDTVLELT